MYVIPVLDIMGGQVVRGIAGRRAEYRPIETPLAASPDPVEIAVAFREQFGLQTLYVADLDAIGGSEPDWETYTRLLQNGLRICVDAGIADLSRGRQMAEFAASAIDRIVIGLESIPSFQLLDELTAAIGSSRTIFSLDLKEGKPLTTAVAWRGLSPQETADVAWHAGVREMIVLDLARVGVSTGVGTEDLCRELKEQHPDLAIIAGGGVRSAEDLRSLAASGCSAVLVASALHDGRITREAIQDLRARQ
jgi:phosphoribosylformimino-5-aminoimidazole carboxamide ribotide isomerase